MRGFVPSLRRRVQMGVTSRGRSQLQHSGRTLLSSRWTLADGIPMPAKERVGSVRMGRVGILHPRSSSTSVSDGEARYKKQWGLERVPESCHAVVLFDGVCNFCNAWVNLVIDNDPSGYFCFAPLQSDVGKMLLQQAGRKPDDLSSFLLVDEVGYWTESTAALRVAEKLNNPALAVTASAAKNIIPKPLRDMGYYFVSENRYNILGRIGDFDTPRCKIGKDAQVLKARFLDE